MTNRKLMNRTLFVSYGQLTNVVGNEQRVSAIRKIYSWHPVAVNKKQYTAQGNEGRKKRTMKAENSSP